MISKIFNLRHESMALSIASRSQSLENEYFQFGLPVTKNPKVRGSMLFVANKNFVERNWASIRSFELVDVLGCRLQLAKNSERFPYFDASAFSVNPPDVMAAMAEVVKHLDEYNLVVNGYCARLKSRLARFLRFPSSLEASLWLEVPTFPQLCLGGTVFFEAEDVRFVVPNCYVHLIRERSTHVSYYNPRGGIEAAVDEYLLDRDI